MFSRMWAKLRAFVRRIWGSEPPPRLDLDVRPVSLERFSQQVAKTGGPELYEWFSPWLSKGNRNWQRLTITINGQGLYIVRLKLESGEDVVVNPVAVSGTPPHTLRIGSVRHLAGDVPLQIRICSPSRFEVLDVKPEYRLRDETVREWAEKTGGSLPNPESHAGLEFYSKHPELIP